jgi:hypothetical protein
MKTPSIEPNDKWLGVIGKSLAFVCLHLADLDDESLVTKKEFLERLGLTRADIAPLLNTTEETLRVAGYKKPKKGKVVAKKIQRKSRNR